MRFNLRTFHGFFPPLHAIADHSKVNVFLGTCARWLAAVHDAIQICTASNGNVDKASQPLDWYLSDNVVLEAIIHFVKLFNPIHTNSN